jgi:hypothetical protein
MFRGAGEGQFRAQLQALTGSVVAVDLVDEGEVIVAKREAPEREAVVEPMQMSDDDFKNDPFIRAAVERFAAQVTKIPKGTTT